MSEITNSITGGKEIVDYKIFYSPHEIEFIVSRNYTNTTFKVSREDWDVFKKLLEVIEI